MSNPSRSTLTRCSVFNYNKHISLFQGCRTTGIPGFITKTQYVKELSKKRKAKWEKAPSQLSTFRKARAMKTCLHCRAKERSTKLTFTLLSFSPAKVQTFFLTCTSTFVNFRIYSHFHLYFHQLTLTPKSVIKNNDSLVFVSNRLVTFLNKNLLFQIICVNLQKVYKT